MKNKKQVNEAQGAKVNTVNQVNEVAEQIIEATKEAKEAKQVKQKKQEVQTYKDQLAQNRRFKEAKNLECQKLGYALKFMRQFDMVWDKPVIEYIETMQNDPVLFKLAEIECKRSNAGNFTPWLIQCYIRKQINKR